jgi:hypothetical protein
MTGILSIPLRIWEAMSLILRMGEDYSEISRPRRNGKQNFIG